MPKPGSQPANKLVIRFVKAILIFASHRFRKRIMRTPDAAMATTMMAPMLIESLIFYFSPKLYELYTIQSPRAFI